ncbi:uncharacterized protein HGUI_03826 [Hanseniaspora guilliermondii]|uniref:Protein-lysine N-methyltransferase EFM2 n=1 Tax=Hanseniaspora guilliermondii TaxID=56406 RepID=A0A1L0CSP5_9ASCO|nr:uncharacterized protein HGUI_03826 [Hanseniaspora guilliermondii]
MVDHIFFSVGHLPPIHIIPEYLLLDILAYLEPAPTVNFQEVEREFHLISAESFEWLSNSWYGHPFNETKQREYYSKVLFSLVPSSSKSEIIEYLTRLLSHPRVHTFEQGEEIMDMISCLIAKYCGSAVSGGIMRNFLLSTKNKSVQVPIKIKELGIANDNIGWKTWGASYPFAQRVIEDDTLFNLIPTKLDETIKILELGSGTGLVGVSIVKKLQMKQLSNWRLYLTDLPEIVGNLRENIILNNVNINDNVLCEALDWQIPSEFKSKTNINKFDYVVVCDCLYSPEHPNLVANAIDEFLSEHGLLYIELPLREKYEDERNNLWDLLKKKGLKKIIEKEDQGFDDYGETKYVFQCYERTTLT